MIWLICAMIGGTLQFSYTLLRLGEPTLTNTLFGAVLWGSLLWCIPRSFSRFFKISAKGGAMLRGDGNFEFEVVGESFYQDALSEAAGGKTFDGVRSTVYVFLAPEPDNKHDPDAVSSLTLSGPWRSKASFRTCDALPTSRQHKPRHSDQSLAPTLPAWGNRR